MPPFRLAQQLAEATDKEGPQYQRLTWDALRKSINGLVNKVRVGRGAGRTEAGGRWRGSDLHGGNSTHPLTARPRPRPQVNTSNLAHVLPELFQENLVRGRGVLARSVMKSQMASPQFSAVFAALVAVVNTKLPTVGALVLRRCVLQFRRAFRRNDKPVCLAAARFLATLVNQHVAHELLALEVCALLLGTPTEDSVEVAVEFLQAAGAALMETSPGGVHSVFERLRAILHEGALPPRTQYLIEGLFALRKAAWEGHPAIQEGLDLVDEADAVVHEVSLDDDLDAEASLDVFAVDPQFADNEARYAALRASILGEDEAEEEGVGAQEASQDELDGGEDGDGGQLDEGAPPGDSAPAGGGPITDATEANLVNLRRVIYLTIMSSLDFEEAGHKLLKIHLAPGQERELCTMLLECCIQERTYLRYYGLLACRFCFINATYVAFFDDLFGQQYATVHRLETNKLRNCAKFFAHLLAADALPWSALAYIQLTEEATTSRSRLFVKILFQELAEQLGLRTLNARLVDPSLGPYVAGVLPRDTPQNTRFAVNFFTSIGLGGVTDGLREHLKQLPALLAARQQQLQAAAPSSSSDTSSSSSSDSDSSSSSSSDSGDRRRRKRRRHSKS